MRSTLPKSLRTTFLALAATTAAAGALSGGCAGSRTLPVSTGESSGGHVIIGYVFPREGVLDAATVDASRLTHINYAFANVADGKVVEGSAHDAGNFQALSALRRAHAHLKVLVAVGGWTWSGGFSDAALTPTSRSRFVQSAVDFVRRHDLDGFDVDWEYPGLPGAGNTHRPADKENFTALMRELRQALDEAGAAGGRRYLLTLAAGAFPRFLENTEMHEVQAVADYVNLMTYDFRVPSAEPIAGHHANLFASPTDPEPRSADRAVRDFLAAGVPAGKLVLGVPFYGRAWVDVADNPPAHGLFRPGKAPASRLDVRYGSLLAHFIGRGGFERHWDEAARAPYLWNAAERTFIAYDDPESLREKCRYVREEGLAGTMFWEYFADPSGTLLGTLHEELRERR